ncbi:ABC-type nitrate/sulfonate/bicarbonate transport system permease component [Kineococcus radiotolerans]|uniref:Binding-protein-dependent transport systems inner membrane component n=2 Tax=Kineococcus radiotolerans TaxID=131568 RepID=A6W7K4_KINRD|nr:ABC transporter permease subunit [Kineococcus radiotolerans]ABS02793.1 binding-protein-dependent transport systems inner membrane component [Kineococcus radiotolerans SRS30216 = ATCC BAA-149]MBB2900013.1 ABC-type nitrate/sulfonate/bicarbonate transport system permease component [Kineococcus radiotolerans]
MATTTVPAPAEVHENRSGASVAAAVGRRIGVSVLTLVISSIVLVVAWYALLRVLAIDEFIGKRPVDVYRWLVTDEDAAVHRSDVGGWLATTLADSATGFAAGVVGAVVVASLFTVLRPLEFVFMPLAMMLRSVPLVAMAPIIGMTFHAEWLRAATIGGVVVFFPVLVNAAIGLRSASPQALDVIRVNGGSRWTALRLVAVPTALPNLFAAIRISVPGAVIGAMLYEWLFSGRGLGAEIFRANAQVQYSKLWSIVVVVTFASILLYTLVSIVETLVLTKWGPDAGRR